MPDLLTFDAANKWLEGRVSVPTARDSARISSEMAESVRNHAFFSARVTQANVLDQMRSVVGEVAAGRMGLEDGRNRLQSFLAAQGVGTPELEPDSPGYDKAAAAVKNVASTRRLDLVLDQNVRMANAVGQRQVGASPAIAERWPYWRYIARMDGRERPAHGELNNLVLPKDDPFWNTHTPPWEFGCRCRLEHCDAEEAAQFGGVGRAVVSSDQDGSETRAVVSLGSGRAFEVMRPSNGFAFRPDTAFSQGDMSLVRNVKDRQQILGEVVSKLQKDGGTWRIVSKPQSTDASPRLPKEALKISRDVRKLSKEAAAGRTSSAEYDLGSLAQEHADSLGIRPEDSRMRLVSHDAAVGQKLSHNRARKDGASTGTRHWNVNHYQWMLDPAQVMRLFGETIWNPAAEVRIDIRPGKRPLLVVDGGDGKGLLTASLEKGWMEIDFLSLWNPPPQYRAGFDAKI